MEHIQDLSFVLDNVKSQLDLASIITGAFTIVMAMIYLFNYQSKRIEKEASKIAEKHIAFQETINVYLDEIKNRIPNQKYPSLYKTYLHQLIKFTDHFFGKFTFFNVKTFFLVLKITFLYSFSFFLIGWLLGGSGKMGEMPLLPDDNGKRFFIGFFFMSIIIWVSLHVLNLFIAVVHYLINKNFIKSLKASILLIIYIFLIAGASSMIINKSEYGLGAIIVTMAVSFAVAIRFNVIFAFALLSIVSWALIVKGFDAITLFFFIQYKFFGFILPVINAFFDYMSIYISRYFAKKVYNAKTKREIIYDLTLDTIIAGLLAYFQYLLLFKSMYLYNTFLIGIQELMIPVQVYKDLFLENPFNKDILWITLMIFSTFVPTFIHIVVALSALATKQINITKMNNLKTQLENIQPNDEIRKVEKVSNDLAHYNLKKEINRSIILGFLLVLLFVIVFTVFIYKIFIP